MPWSFEPSRVVTPTKFGEFSQGIGETRSRNATTMTKIPFQGIQTSDQDFGRRDLENRGHLPNSDQAGLYGED
jgi:hypothetical protein